MDAEDFDDLTRALRSRPTRRLALGALSWLGLAALAGADSTRAKKKGGHKPNKPKKKKKSSPPPVSPPPQGQCQVDADCAGDPSARLCCFDGGIPACKVCCADNRGCPPNFFCIDGGAICI